MEPIVRAVDVGYGYTKYVTSAKGEEVHCASFPSIAYPSLRDPMAQTTLERRQTVAIPVQGLFYEVGPDVHLAADTFRATQWHDRYTESPEYAALLRGALALMNVDVIDLLVVGLPVAAWIDKKAALEQAAAGRHDVGGRFVTVKQALAVAQPQGALVYYATLHHKVPSMAHEASLIIDAGTRTFDWLVADGFRLVRKQSYSVNRGIADISQAIAAEIGTAIGMRYREVDAIDHALHSGKGPIIFQKPYDLTPMMPMAEGIAQQAVSAMMQQIDTAYGFQHIILAGGGAFLFKRAVKQAFPKHKILEVKEPFYANVKGFQLAGQTYLASQRVPKPVESKPVASPRPSDSEPPRE